MPAARETGNRAGAMMANNRTKIEKYQLEGRVAELMRSGVVASRPIAAMLNAEAAGRYTISYKAVAEYIRTLKTTATGQAAKIISEHVDRTISSDLEALERMQSVSYRWATEDPRDLADRLSTAMAAVDGCLSRWKDLVMAAESPAVTESGKRRALKAIVQEALNIVLAEDRLQDQRTRAMMTVLKIVALKVDKGALMEGEGRGNIIIVDSDGRVKDGPVGGDVQRQFKMVIGGASARAGKDG